MGGRGASSASGKHSGLPGGAVAFTFGDEKKRMTIYENNGMIFLSNSVGTTARGRIIDTDLSLVQLYKNAKASGQNIKLHSSSEMDVANRLFSKRKEENRHDIDYAELHPNVGRTGIPARKLLHTKKRARGGLYY